MCLYVALARKMNGVQQVALTPPAALAPVRTVESQKLSAHEEERKALRPSICDVHTERGFEGFMRSAMNLVQGF